MRFMIILILVLLAVLYFMPEPDPVPAEESFIGDQVKILRKAETYQDEYLKNDEERQKRMEEELEKAAGGG